MGERLRELTRAGRWEEMPSAIDDAMLDTMVVSAPYARIADALAERYAGVATRIGFPLPADPAHDAQHADAVRRLRGLA